MREYIVKIPAVNLQAIAAMVFFALALAAARATVNIYSGKWKAHPAILFYVRVLLGFFLAGAIVLGYYSFAGIEVIPGRW
ncbi:MAG: flagellar biosynthesis protein FliR [Synergistaceae bacterium]|nr:flagellar biosynthesis protein FliR [Synergistaceae bacterium]